MEEQETDYSSKEYITGFWDGVRIEETNNRIVLRLAHGPEQSEKVTEYLIQKKVDFSSNTDDKGITRFKIIFKDALEVYIFAAVLTQKNFEIDFSEPSPF